MSAYFTPEHQEKLRRSALSNDHIEALRWRTAPRDRLLIEYLKPDGSPELCHNSRPFLRWRTSDEWRAQQVLRGNLRPPKYISPKGQGNRLYHSHLAIHQGDYERRLNDRLIALRITEGELKVEAGAAHDPQRVTIGIAGVSSWRDRYDGGDESRPLVDFEEITLDGREVRLAFDSDFQKPQVASALQALAEYLADRGAHVLIEVLPNGLDGERLGLDDLIYRHGPELLLQVAAIARHAFKCHKGKGGDVERTWAFNPQPLDTRERNVYLAGMLGPHWRRSSDAKDHWQRWSGANWEAVAGDDLLAARVERFMQLQGWKNRELATIRSLLAAFRRSIEPTVEGAAAADLLPFRNGCLELSSGTLRPHDPSHGNSWSLPYAYDPEATCPRTEAFLLDRLGDPASVAIFRAFARGLLVGDRLKAFLEITGPSNTGKSVMANLLVALVGNTNTAAGTLQRLEDRTQRFETLKLRSKRLGIFSEAQDFAGQLQVLKALTGGDPIAAEVKGGRHLDFTFTGGVVLVGNGPIRASDPTGAVINRRRSLLAEKVVAAAAERPMLDPDGQGGWRGELAAELPGLVNWCLAMPAADARAALARDVRSLVRAETELDVLLSTDLLAEWADDHLVWDPACNPARVGRAGDSSEVFLFPSYLGFVEQQGRHCKPLSVKTFKKKLVDLLRDTLALPLPAGSITSGVYRGRELGSVIPNLRWRYGIEEGPGVIRHAVMARISATAQPASGTGAERVGDCKNPVGNGWNRWNGSSQLGHKEKIPEGVSRHKAEGAAGSVPSVPSIPQKASHGPTPVPEPVPVAAGIVETEPALGPGASRSPLVDAEGAGCVAGSDTAAAGRPDPEANAARSNLTTFNSGDRVYVAHQRLPFGRLHQAVVSKVINASVHFAPPLEGLLNDPNDPGGGQWLPPAPLQMASSTSCLPELGTAAGVVIEQLERDGQPLRRLSYRQTHADGSETTVAREIPVPGVGWQPLDDKGLDTFLAELQLQDRTTAGDCTRA
jgi:phage/plasmid-associated DNA primase